MWRNPNSQPDSGFMQSQKATQPVEEIIDCELTLSSFNHQKVAGKEESEWCNSSIDFDAVDGDDCITGSRGTAACNQLSLELTL